jgi:hypothetical protein
MSASKHAERTDGGKTMFGDAAIAVRDGPNQPKSGS